MRVFLYHSNSYFCFMAMRPQTIKLHQDIKAEFNKLSNVREFGVQKHSIEWILNKVAEKFYKSPKTIENIVFNRVAIVESPQVKLDL